MFRVSGFFLRKSLVAARLHPWLRSNKLLAPIAPLPSQQTLLPLHRYLSERIKKIYHIFSEHRFRQTYDCCGAYAVLRRDSSHFCPMCNPLPFYEPCDDLWT